MCYYIRRVGSMYMRVCVCVSVWYIYCMAFYIDSTQQRHGTVGGSEMLPKKAIKEFDEHD